MPKRTFYTYITIITLTLLVVAIMEWLNAKRIGRFMKTYEEMERQLSQKERNNISNETKEKDDRIVLGVAKSGVK
jgi:hypothetical protein